MDKQQRAFVETFRSFLDDVVHRQQRFAPTLTPLGEVAQVHLKTAVAALPVVTEMIPQHRYVDADIALSLLAGEGGELIGVTGGQARQHENLSDLLTHSFVQFAPGPVDFIATHIGPDKQRQVVGFGLRLLYFEGAPVAVLQRMAQPQFGRNDAELEVLAADASTSERMLTQLRSLMIQHSALRGQVLSFEGGDYGPRAAGVTFLARPDVAASDVVLPSGVLSAIEGHVIGITQRADALRRAHRHLKRGVLLYGPPGTGKTLTVRYLIGKTEQVTCVLLTGASIRFISEATELARALQPSLIVLEDVDLVAMERDMHGGPQPLLFAVLDALDGLEGDADVAFVLTTNRVETLEPALVQRPGRVDLAVELALPGAEERQRLFALYAEGLPLSPAAVAAAADRTTGVTGSFAKELMRRVVLRAAEDQRTPGDHDLAAALDELLSASEALTRHLLGGRERHQAAERA